MLLEFYLSQTMQFYTSIRKQERFHDKKFTEKIIGPRSRILDSQYVLSQKLGVGRADRKPGWRLMILRHKRGVNNLFNMIQKIRLANSGIIPDTI